MPEQVVPIPINIYVDEKSQQQLAQMAKDIDVIVRALNKLTDKRILNDKDPQTAKTLTEKLEAINKQYAQATGKIERLALESKKWKMEMQAATDNAGIKRARAELERVNRELKQISGNTNTWGKALGSFQFKFNALGNAAAMLSGKMWEGVTKFFSGMTNGFPVIKEFEKSFAAVESILTKVESKEFVPMLKQTSIDVIRRYGLAIEDVNLALYDAISSNVKAGDAAQFLDASAKLAVGGLTTLNASVKGLASISNAFGLSMSNVSDVAAGFFTAQKYGITYVDEMVESLGRMNTVAKISGASWQEMMAAFSSITLSGLNTEETVTALRNVFNELLKPSKQAADAILVLKSGLDGIEVPMGAIELRAKGFVGTMEALKEVYERYPEALSKIFGNIRGFTGITALLGTQMEKFKDILDELNDSGGNLENLLKAVGDQMNTTTKIVEVRKGAWKAWLLDIENGTGIISRFTKSLNEYFTLLAIKGQGFNGKSFWEQELMKVKAFDPQVEFKGMIDAANLYDEIIRDIDNKTITLTEGYDRMLGELSVANDNVQATIRAESGLKEGDTETREMLAKNYIEYKAYYDKMGILWGEFYKKYYGVEKGVFEGVDELNQMNLAALRQYLGDLKKQKDEFSQVEQTTSDYLTLKQKIAEVEAVIATFDDKKEKTIDNEKALNKEQQERLKNIREEYKLLKMQEELKDETAGRDIELKRLEAEELSKIADIEVEDTERLATYKKLIWERYGQQRVAIEKKYNEKATEETLQTFNDQKDIALATNEAYLVEYENQLIASGVSQAKASEEVNKARLEYTVWWAEQELALINAVYGESSTQAQLLAAAIRKMKAEINKPDEEGGNGLTPEQLSQLKQAGNELIEQINEITDAYVHAAEVRTEAIQNELDASTERVRQLESDRDHEWERMKEGYANNYDLKQRELQDERKRQQELQRQKDAALREEQRRQKIQLAMNTIMTVAELGVASAKMIKSGAEEGGWIGGLLALAAVAAMVAGFVGIMSDTKSQVQYREGGFYELEGASHEQGGIDLGGGREAEGGEGHSIFSRKATQRYKKEIIDFTKAANNGRLLSGWEALNRSLAQGGMPNMSIILNDEYSRKIYELQKAQSEKDDIKAVNISPTKTLIIMDGGRTHRYINHNAN